jgi:hypothetical protein
MDRLVQKHVFISLNNGTELEGFISKKDEKYFTLIELNNKIVILKIDDISYVRLGGSEICKTQIPNKVPEFQKLQDEEFSLQMPKEITNNYTLPKFIRKT